MGRRSLLFKLSILLLCLAIVLPIIVFTPLGSRALTTIGVLRPTPTPTRIPPTPTPIPTPQPEITVTNQPVSPAAKVAYLVDTGTWHVLYDLNGEIPLPMASTTKIMTALIAIQTADLAMPVTIQQDAYDRVHNDGGSSANLKVGDTLTLHDLLYGLMLPSGDDAAYAIADALAGSPERFVERMNLFAYRLRLFQTHYANPDGLTLDDNALHYTTAADLVRLTRYAMNIPLFAQIVNTPTYSVPATARHQAYKWGNTNTLLTTYKGMIGVKTGHTDAAGYCLVFAAERGDYHLMGVVLNAASEDLRNQDVQRLLNWGFALPMLPPTYHAQEAQRSGASGHRSSAPAQQAG
jgi:D-alanyl-D-alanine carboxypeptidase (penicillin-binding protein 5/6)